MKSITVLKLKISSSAVALEEIARLCRKGRNAALEDWLLRQRGKPESEKQSKPGRRRKDGKVPESLAESTKIYHAVTSAVPTLGTAQASMIAAALSSHLGAKLDWRSGKTEDGKRPRRRDAILSYEDRPPFFSALEIPLHNANTQIVFGDRLAISAQRLLRDLPAVELDLSMREIPPAVQLILRDLANGQRKLADSKLVYKQERDAWYWHLPVTFETEVRSETEATLWPVLGKDDKPTDRPFRLDLPSGRKWWIGDGRYLLSQVQRLIKIRKEIGWRYRQGMGAGHGRQKIDAAVQKRRLQERNVVAEVRRRAIADVVRQCVRANVGTLIYREPSLPLRKKCWFSAVGLDWDWTRFAADLENAAARQGIEVSPLQWKWKEAIGAAEGESDAA